MVYENITYLHHLRIKLRFSDTESTKKERMVRKIEKKFQAEY